MHYISFMEHDTQKKQITESFWTKVKHFLFGSKLRTGVVIILVIVLGFFIWQKTVGSQNKVQYQTAAVVKDTLVTSVAESGQVAVANRVSVTTQASGAISEIDVKNGDTVTAGQTIAVVTLDRVGQQQQAQAWASYLSAKNALAQDNATLYSQQSTMYTQWNTYYQKAINSTYQNPDSSPNTANRTLPDFTTSQDNWLAAEATYQNQQGVIAKDQSSLTSAWISYQAAAATITAPIAGKISDLTIVPGIQVGTAGTTASSSNTPSSQIIGTIRTQGNPVISVSLSELDATKVQSGQRATVTFDALPNKTFTGKVLGVNTTGTVSSGVTTYPASIQLDLPNDQILPNMSATANIITSVKDNVLLVPLAAVQTSNGSSTVRVLKNGTVTTVPVEVGDSSDTQTEIISGLSEGDTVVIGVTSSSTQATGATSSPFGSTLRLGGFGGGGGGGGAARTATGRGG